MAGDTETITTSMRRADGPRLLDAFRELYAEVIRTARAIGVPDAIPPEPEALKQRLLGILARQRVEAKERLADHEIAELEEAQYVMVAMADEVFLGFDWPGREAWARRPLEAESAYGTQLAGERIFDRLKAILTDRPSVSSDLLGVYLAALCLGFRGRYRVDPTSPDPERFRHELMRELGRVDPHRVARAVELCPDALKDVRDKEPRTSLPSLRDGGLPLIIAVASMLVVGQLLWSYQTAEVRDRLDQVETQKRLALEVRERHQRARTETTIAPSSMTDGGAP